ncbi:TIGR02677 family protein [Kutzneria sp. CA-103260]|nr:TIGR02677 family protein [Kutzneria sp. CA-103260]
MWPTVEQEQHVQDTLVGGETTDRRLLLYAYLQPREHHRTYLTTMRLFASTLLADLSAGEVAAKLAAAEREGLIDPGESRIETVIARLKQLVEWGNLVPGRREVIAASIAEFQHGSVRYQVSKLAVRVQRDVDELLRVPEGAREVSRELLPAIERGLGQLGRSLSDAVFTEGGPGAKRAREALAEQVTTLFLQHAELAVTVRDFYAYLGQIVTRHHLAPDEISGFRNLLVEYIQMVVEDVLRHTPAIAESLGQLARGRSELLRLLGPANALGSNNLGSGDLDLGVAIERSRGRTNADWQDLTDWFVDRPGRPSQVTALREATGRAIGSLLASVKRATSGGGLLPGRRAELLKLAGWFDGATPDQAHSLYAAAFGLYSARNLLPSPEHDGDDEHTPWRDGPLLDVTVSVRSRGDRGARGRTSRIVDDPITEQALLADARAVDKKRSEAVTELVEAAPTIEESSLSHGALDVFCELLTMAMAQRERAEDVGSAADPVRGLKLTVTPEEGRTTTIKTAGGTLTLHNASVALEAGA